MMVLSMVKQQNPYSKHNNKLTIDESLFERIAENDMAAFEQLYRITEKSVYAFVLSILKNHDDALDVVQDTYLKIRGAAHLYKPMGKPMAWIFTIARNLSISRLRLIKRSDNVNMVDMENSISFSYMTNYDDKLVMQATFNILNDQERQIIMLHAVSGLAHHEIADSLGIPLSTELSKYHRGLKKLKKHLSGQEMS
ncbi:MAG: RNA polymerase sigma factor [Sedimentibacter sp.]|uniref:RNA polymerase sigma factor n=1 Tax=Sedimentibacter sp. TaxID=1960295 RepID=UPI0031584C0A